MKLRLQIKSRGHVLLSWNNIIRNYIQSACTGALLTVTRCSFPYLKQHAASRSSASGLCIKFGCRTEQRIQATSRSLPLPQEFPKPGGLNTSTPQPLLDQDLRSNVLPKVCFVKKGTTLVVRPITCTTFLHKSSEEEKPNQTIIEKWEDSFFVFGLFRFLPWQWRVL